MSSYVMSSDGFVYKDLTPMAPDVRPVVVIDPEDRDQVERLARAWNAQIGNFDTAVERMGNALRSLIAPPKPAEPTGLGAVVVATCTCDNRGPLVHEPLSPRFEGRRKSSRANWKAVCGHHAWDKLRDVEIKSEGWSE